MSSGPVLGEAQGRSEAEEDVLWLARCLPIARAMGLARPEKRRELFDGIRGSRRLALLCLADPSGMEAGLSWARAPVADGAPEPASLASRLDGAFAVGLALGAEAKRGQLSARAGRAATALALALGLSGGGGDAEGEPMVLAGAARAGAASADIFGWLAGVEDGGRSTSMPSMLEYAEEIAASMLRSELAGQLAPVAKARPRAL